MQIGFGWTQLIKSGFIFILDLFGAFALFGGDKVFLGEGRDSVELDDDKEDALNCRPVDVLELSNLEEGISDIDVGFSFWSSFCFGLFILQHVY